MDLKLLSLEEKVVTSYLFDQDGVFAGVRLYSRESGTTSTVSFKRGDPEGSTLDGLADDFFLIENSDVLRLVGFRSTKTCEQARQILSLQPIYYSIEPSLCDPDNHASGLLPLSEGMLQEIAAYGPQCGEFNANDGSVVAFTEISTTSQ